MEGIWRHETETTLHDGAGEGAAGSTPRVVAPLVTLSAHASPPVPRAEPWTPPHPPQSFLSHPGPLRPLSSLSGQPLRPEHLRSSHAPPRPLEPSLTLWSPRPCVEPLTGFSAPPGPSGH